MNTLLKHGTLVTASDTFIADLLIEGETITRIGANLQSDDAQVIDCTGKYILPGGIDVHTHLELDVGSTVSSDDFYTGHKAAAFGGTTFHIDFATPNKGESLHSTLTRWRAKSDSKAVIDFGYHMSVIELNADLEREIPQMVDEGLPSLKLYMAYKNKLQVDDATLFRTMQIAAAHGILILVHAENGDTVETLIKQALAEGHTTSEWHARTRPDWVEAEATHRAIALSAVAGNALYVVHVTNAKSLAHIAAARAQHLPIMGETCLQYFHFTADDLLRPDGAKLICSPPLRTAADQTALWDALQRNTLQVISTDHCPFPFDGTQPLVYEGESILIKGKELGRSNFSLTPNGVPGLGDRLPILWTYGVGLQKMSLNQFVANCCTNPAKIFGLYPKKGTLAIGADADIAIWNPDLTQTRSVANAHQRTDYNLYEGYELRGLPEKVFRRGELLVDGDQWLGKAGTGRFTKRRVSSYQ